MRLVRRDFQTPIKPRRVLKGTRILDRQCAEKPMGFTAEL